ncbi:unnamed protein product [Caenorhabditis sp. 36 PRJEB53466]|nr:unnamed protein product [Caenorhabditis sp. 36 PRJEB53466]
MALTPLFTLISAVIMATVATSREAGAIDMRAIRPFPQMSGSEDDDSAKMQVVVVLLVAFCVSLAITLIIRFLRKYSERQRLYSSFT